MGFRVTRDVGKLINRKIEAIKNMAPPTSRKELQKFIGVINYYCDMWPRRSHILAPSNKLTYIKRNFKRAQVKQDDFDEIKRIVTCDTILTYPDFNETFKIHTDASAFQLGAVIIQKGKPIAFYSRKLTDAQQRYTVTEIELLIPEETLKEYRTILLGQKLRIRTDHKNLTCKNINTDRVFRWRLIFEEYGTDIEYIRSENNIVADGLSRIPLNGDEDTTQKSTYQQEIVS